MSMVSVVPTLREICINKTHRSKTLHLFMEINNYVVEGLVDTRASMSVMDAAVVRELGIMHLGSPIMTKGEDASALNSDVSTDSNEHCDGDPRQFEQMDDEDEFKDTELEDLVRSKGPQ
ncbi:unnamed protein product [Sphagnum balticum]